MVTARSCCRAIPTRRRTCGFSTRFPSGCAITSLRVLDERAAVWRKLLADAEAAGEIRDGLDLSVVRLLVLGMINWSIEWYKPGGLSPDEIAETAAAILFDGIAKKKTKR